MELVECAGVLLCGPAGRYKEALLMLPMGQGKKMQYLQSLLSDMFTAATHDDRRYAANRAWKETMHYESGAGLVYRFVVDILGWHRSLPLGVNALTMWCNCNAQVLASYSKYYSRATSSSSKMLSYNAGVVHHLGLGRVPRNTRKALEYYADADTLPFTRFNVCHIAATDGSCFARIADLAEVCKSDIPAQRVLELIGMFHAAGCLHPHTNATVSNYCIAMDAGCSLDFTHECIVYLMENTPYYNEGENELFECPTCGVSVEDDAVYIQSCGHSMCGACNANAESMICPQCATFTTGNPVSQEARPARVHCAHCGGAASCALCVPTHCTLGASDTAYATEEILSRNAEIYSSAAQDFGINLEECCIKIGEKRKALEEMRDHMVNVVNACYARAIASLDACEKHNTHAYKYARDMCIAERRACQGLEATSRYLRRRNQVFQAKVTRANVSAVRVSVMRDGTPNTLSEYLEWMEDSLAGTPSS